MEITKEIAKIMYESGIEELVNIAVESFPELDDNWSEESKAFYILQKKIKKINKGKNLNLKDDHVNKYYPVLYYDSNGVFSFFYVRGWSSTLHFPAPLCFVDEEDCKVFVKENLELYRQLYEGECI